MGDRDPSVDLSREELVDRLRANLKLADADDLAQSGMEALRELLEDVERVEGLMPDEEPEDVEPRFHRVFTHWTRSLEPDQIIGLVLASATLRQLTAAFLYYQRGGDFPDE
jgi:hypothetical protein